MIYKIIMDFNDLQDIVNKLIKDFYILFYNNSLYVCNKSLKNMSIEEIKDILLYDNIFITNINEINLKYESEHVKNWCTSYFVEKDIKDFENEQQDLLKEYMKVLDDCEKQLDKIVEKGG